MSDKSGTIVTPNEARVHAAHAAAVRNRDLLRTLRAEFAKPGWADLSRLAEIRVEHGIHFVQE